MISSGRMANLTDSATNNIWLREIYGSNLSIIIITRKKKRLLWIMWFDMCGLDSDIIRDTKKQIKFGVSNLASLHVDVPRPQQTIWRWCCNDINYYHYKKEKEIVMNYVIWHMWIRLRYHSWHKKADKIWRAESCKFARRCS